MICKNDLISHLMQETIPLNNIINELIKASREDVQDTNTKDHQALAAGHCMPSARGELSKWVNTSFVQHSLDTRKRALYVQMPHSTSAIRPSLLVRRRIPIWCNELDSCVQRCISIREAFQEGCKTSAQDACRR